MHDVPSDERLSAEELRAVREDLERRLAAHAPLRWNAQPEDVRRSVAHLVLSLVDFVRRLLERQAIRRVDRGTLTPDEIERLGCGLMELEKTVRELADHFGISPEELGLDLGPLGRA
jgi:hypothetical protein